MKKHVIKLDVAAPSANRLWRNFHGRNVLSSDYRKFITIVENEIKSRKLSFDNIATDDYPFAIVNVKTRPVRRSGDVGNRSKAVMDALTRAGYWVDDRIVAVVEERFSAPNKNYPHGGTLVTITPCAVKFNEDEW